MTEPRFTLIGRTADGRLIMQRGSAVRYVWPSEPEGKAPRPLVRSYTARSNAGKPYTVFYAAFNHLGKKYSKQSTRKAIVVKWLDEMKPIYESRQRL